MVLLLSFLLLYIYIYLPEIGVIIVIADVIKIIFLGGTSGVKKRQTNM